MGRKLPRTSANRKLLLKYKRHRKRKAGRGHVRNARALQLCTQSAPLLPRKTRSRCKDSRWHPRSSVRLQVRSSQHPRLTLATLASSIGTAAFSFRQLKNAELHLWSEIRGSEAMRSVVSAVDVVLVKSGRWSSRASVVSGSTGSQGTRTISDK